MSNSGDETVAPTPLPSRPNSPTKKRPTATRYDTLPASQGFRSEKFSADGFGEQIDERGRRVFVPSTPAQEPAGWHRIFPGGYNPKYQIPLRGKAMIWAIQAVGGLAILFYGYDQGVMSGVNNTPEYKRLMGVDSNPESSRDSAAIGGIVAIYYAGTLIGGLVGGWLGDEIGRIRTTLIACTVAIIGAAFQASAMQMTWMMFARIVTGLGTGALNALVPVYSSEVSTHDARGAILGFEFFLNIMGLATAYWLEFGLKYYSGRSESFVWRFPLAFQIVFLLILLLMLPLFPESPRWLAKVGRVDEARHVLAVLRTPDANEDDPEVNEEMFSIMEVVDLERREARLNGYVPMMFGGDSKVHGKDHFHLLRRTWLVIGLQIWQELTGIGVVTVFAPTVFKQAGYSAYKADLLSGINDICYMFSFLIAVFTLDRIGRRVTLYWGAIVMGVALIIAGIGARYVPTTSESVSQQWGAVVATGTFIYTSTFGATWLTVPWLYPTGEDSGDDEQVAVRMAQDLGYHRLVAAHYPRALISDRTRAWLSCLITDRWYSCSYGQPPLIDVTFCDDPLDPFSMPELQTRFHRYQLQLYKFSMLLGDVYWAIHRPRGLEVATNNFLQHLLNKIDQTIAEIPEEFGFYGVMTQPQGGLLHMVVCCVEILFLRGFTVQHKAAPPHITFRPKPSRWRAVISRSKAIIDWADASGDLVLDTWLIGMYSLTHAALVQYQTYTSFRDPEALRSLRTAHLCLERWASGHRDDNQLALRAKATDIVRLLYKTACKKTTEAGGLPQYSTERTIDARVPSPTQLSQDELESLGLLDFAAWPLPEFASPEFSDTQPQYDPLLGIDLLAAMNRP